jgi:hypothetical protein
VTKNSVGDGLVILIPKKRRFWNAVLVASFWEGISGMVCGAFWHKNAPTCK